MRSPITILSELASKFTCKVYLIHFDSQAPYLLFAGHKVMYFASKQVYHVISKNQMVSTTEPVNHLLRYYG